MTWSRIQNIWKKLWRTVQPILQGLRCEMAEVVLSSFFKKVCIFIWSWTYALPTTTYRTTEHDRNISQETKEELRRDEPGQETASQTVNACLQPPVCTPWQEKETQFWKAGRADIHWRVVIHVEYISDVAKCRLFGLLAGDFCVWHLQALNINSFEVLVLNIAKTLEPVLNGLHQLQVYL